MIIELNPDLPEVALRHYHTSSAAALYDSTVPEKVRVAAYREPETCKEKFASATFGDDRALYHLNYSDYLCACYQTHQSIVITPDIIWHTILCEIATTVALHPKLYAPLFTTTPDEKQEIAIPSGSPDALPLPELYEALRERVPSDTAPFLPEFTTTTQEALFVRYAAFADICSPYYSYGTFCCGYRAIKVLGEPADYMRIIDHAGKLIALFETIGDVVLVSYLGEKIIPLLNDFIVAVADGDKDFFNHILTTKRCGSGSQYEVFGWWPARMYVKSYSKQMPHNMPTNIARVEWTNFDTGRKFALSGGVMTSKLEDGFMVPQWEFVTNERFE